MADLWFVTGGARSGKSRFAEKLARESGRSVVYLATMPSIDKELAQRIEAHRQGRPIAWRTVEAPNDPVSALVAADDDSCVLLDCLSLWVSNRLVVLGEEPTLNAVEILEHELRGEIQRLIEAVSARSGETITVTNEVGASVVPEYPLGRIYRDLLGRVNQHVAAASTQAWFLVAGRPLLLPQAIGDSN